MILNNGDVKMNNVKINNTNDAIVYIIYMIMGSYFKKTICKSTMREKQLKIVYCETKRDTQINIEERCINYIENKFIGVVPEEIFGDMVEVQFVLNRKENRTDVVFIGFDWKLTMWGTNSSKGVMFDYILETIEPE